MSLAPAQGTFGCVGFFDALTDLFASGELPDSASQPVRVNFVGTVTSANDYASPITDTRASLIVFTLLERIIITSGGNSMAGSSETETFRDVGSVALGGPLVIADAKGRLVTVPTPVDQWGRLAMDVVPIGNTGIAISGRLPEGVAHLVQQASGQHMLFYRETLFRNGDRLRVRATVAEQQSTVAAGYRDAIARSLVARPDLARITLVEML